MRIKSILQVSFSFSFEKKKKLSRYQTEMLKVSPTRKNSLGRISGLNKHMLKQDALWSAEILHLEMVFELTGHVGMSNIDMSNVKIYSNIL